MKRAVDESRSGESPLRILATDSAASLLHSGARESGVGRWDEMPIESLRFSEFRRLSEAVQPLPPASVVERFLLRGGYPAHLTTPDDSLVHQRILEDVVGRAIYRDLARLRLDTESVHRLFVYLARSSGSVFNATKRAKNLESDPRSVQKWLRALIDARLVFELPQRLVQRSSHNDTKASTQLRAHPKIYAGDQGLVSALLWPFQANLRPKLFETAVVRELRGLLAGISGSSLSYFRRRNTEETDLVLDIPEGAVAIEVTSSRDPQRILEKARNVSRDGERMGAIRKLVVHGGPEMEAHQGVRLVTLAAFLELPAEAVGVG